jgi:hypothetical protein
MKGPVEKGRRGKRRSLSIIAWRFGRLEGVRSNLLRPFEVDEVADEVLKFAKIPNFGTTI